VSPGTNTGDATAKVPLKAKYEYAKIQREILFEDASAMIFIDFLFVT